MTYPNRSSESPIFVFYTVSQVVTWLQGPGSELLKTQQEIGDSMRAAQALQQKHEEIESQHSVMQHTHTKCMKLIIILANMIVLNQEPLLLSYSKCCGKCTQFGSADFCHRLIKLFPKILPCFLSVLLNQADCVSIGVVRCVRGVEPANCHLAQYRGGGGCGGAEGTAAAAE